ncbi:MAG: molybdenum cofactor guanylyltransferase [Deltaproteobacteria bacterium]|nr:molybdenum cofactor guanylyltransferase [Deltaproteobacteria bacterium]
MNSLKPKPDDSEQDIEKYSVSGVILAGGANSRFNGRNKAFINIAGRSIIENAYSILKSLFKQIIIVTNQPEKYAEFNADIATDIFSIKSSLTGIHAGLFYAKYPFSFVAGCDMPFLNKELIEALAKEIKPHLDVIIPETPKGLEPLCAVYSKKMLVSIEGKIKAKNFYIKSILNKVKTKRVSEKFLRRYDKDLISFFNINSPEELEKAETFLK